MLSAFTPTIRPNEKVLPLRGSPLNRGTIFQMGDPCSCVSRSLSVNANEGKKMLTTLSFFLQPFYLDLSACS